MFTCVRMHCASHVFSSAKDLPCDTEGPCASHAFAFVFRIFSGIIMIQPWQCMTYNWKMNAKRHFVRCGRALRITWSPVKATRPYASDHLPDDRPSLHIAQSFRAGLPSLHIASSNILPKSTGSAISATSLLETNLFVVQPSFVTLRGAERNRLVPCQCRTRIPLHT